MVGDSTEKDESCLSSIRRSITSNRIYVICSVLGGLLALVGVAGLPIGTVCLLLNV